MLEDKSSTWTVLARELGERWKNFLVYLCVASEHTYRHTVPYTHICTPSSSKPFSSNSAYSDSLLMGNIGKPLALIMLHSNLLPLLSFNHNPCPCGCVFVCTCSHMWLYCLLLLLQTVLSHFHSNASGVSPDCPTLLYLCHWSQWHRCQSLWLSHSTVVHLWVWRLCDTSRKRG